ncbi:MAG TPA: c-type cytochrome [Solirubrobacteraceae bacterium]|nr:c-type cytochrome [Solirubrobacteraceae bacterium]
MRLLRWWWRRPARSPYAVRILLAAVLGTVGVLGVAGPSFGRSTSSSVASAPTKYPINPGPGDLTTSFPSSSSLISEGRTLYDNGCSACHGLGLQGRQGIAPALKGIGAGPIDFYVSTGRMPLQNPHDEPTRARPVYDTQQTHALIAFITHAGGGPRVAPAAEPAAGSLSQGMQVFTEHCAGCHQMVGRGGLTIGAWVPRLQNATAQEIAEAVRMGPYVMPHFDSKQITQEQLNSLVRYVLWTRHPSDVGGWGIYNIGPIPEGLVAWFLALLALMIVARLIGERTEGANT